MAVNTKSLDLESGSSQYASITDASQTGLDITGDISIEAWVKPESLGANITIASKWEQTSGNQRGYLFRISSTPSLQFYISPDGTSATNISVAHSFTVGQWYHVAVAYNASAGTARVHVNGVQIGNTASGLDTSIHDTSAPFAIGTYDSTVVAPMDGLIDEVRVWNDVRTPTEIKANMFADVTGQANLQGYWKLNDDYTDSSTNGNDLTASGSPTFSSVTRFSTYRVVDPKIYSLDLENGSSQYASITDASQTGLGITGDMTVEAWVRLESTGANQNTIVSKWDLGAAARAYRLQVNSSSNLALYLSDNGTFDAGHALTATSNITLGTGQWYHVAVSVDLSEEAVIFYVNGVTDAITPSGSIGTSLYDNAIPFTIGAYQNSGTPTNFFDGLITEVRVWDDVRTADEIKDNMFKKLTGTEANLQGYWKLENDYTDETANGNDLTASGSPVFSTTVPYPTYTAVRQSALSETDLASDANLQGYYKFESGALTTDSSSGGNTLTNNNSASETTGIFSGASSLNGTNQYFNTSDAMGIDGNDDITISGWFKMNAEISAGVDIFAHHSSTTAIARWFQFYYNYNSGNRRLQFDNGGSSVAIFYCTLGTGWNHFAFVRSGTVGYAYINGVLVGSGAQGSSAASTNYLRLGVDPAGNYANASLDDVAVFNRALSAQEVLDIYTGTATAGGNFFLMF